VARPTREIMRSPKLEAWLDQAQKPLQARALKPSSLCVCARVCVFVCVRVCVICACVCVRARALAADQFAGFASEQGEGAHGWSYRVACKDLRVEGADGCCFKRSSLHTHTHTHTHTRTHTHTHESMLADLL